jgi:hypothetical protein
MFRRVALLSCLCVLVGCVGFSSNYNAFPFEGMAPMAPPENIVEQKPVIESPGDEIWLPGYWSYTGLDYVWVPGRVVDRPDTTAAWAAPRWELRGYGWTFVPGRWE